MTSRLHHVCTCLLTEAFGGFRGCCSAPTTSINQNGFTALEQPSRIADRRVCILLAANKLVSEGLLLTIRSAIHATGSTLSSASLSAEHTPLGSESPLSASLRHRQPVPVRITGEVRTSPRHRYYIRLDSATVYHGFDNEFANLDFLCVYRELDFWRALGWPDRWPIKLVVTHS